MRHASGWTWRRLLALCAAAWLPQAASAGVTVLHGFDFADGEYPIGRVLLGRDGRLYGTTNAGGAGGLGTVFAVGNDKVHQILHAFTGSDGQQLDVGLVQRADGTLFGSTPQGTVVIGPIVTGFGGTVFRLAPDGGGFTTLRSFGGASGEGRSPGQLLDGGDGFLYGVMRYGGALDAGTVFRIAPDGSGLATLFEFTQASGLYPRPQLTLGSDGRLYGALQYGPGVQANGALFSIARDGSGYTVLHSFGGSDGSAPSGALAEVGGLFYGVAGSGGPNGGGTVFRLAPDGTLDTLYAFNGSDGGSPVGPLVPGPDGRLYGLTYGGGSGGGTIFRIAPGGGEFLTLHRLVPADGTGPVNGPVMDSTGLLYGATTRYGGGSLATGSVFRFDALAPQPAGLSLDKHCYNEFNTCMTPFNTTVGVPYDIFWSSENLTSCTASGDWSGAKPGGGRVKITPTRAGLYVYRLVCSGPGGRRSAVVAVSVI